MSIILEKIRKLFVKKQKGVVEFYPEIWVGGKPQPASYSQFYTYYRNHPLVKSSVDSLAGMVAGSGFYTTVDNPENPNHVKAKTLVDEFNAKVNMDELLLEVVKDMLITGNSFLEKVFDEDGRLVKVKRLPTTRMKVVRDKFGEVVGYVEEAVGLKVDFKPGEVVHFKWNDVELTGYGVGIVEPVSVFLEFDKKNMENMVEVVYKTAYPIPIFMFKNKADVDYFVEVLRKRKHGDPILAVGEIRSNVIQVDSRVRFGEFIDSVERKIFEGMRGPLLSWLKNATEASAKVMLECVDRDVKTMQRYVKRKVEGEIWKPLLETCNLKNIHVKLNWGYLKSGMEDLKISDLVALAKADVGVLNRQQVVKMLQMMGIPIPEPEIPKLENLEEQVLTWTPRWYNLTNQIVLQLQNPNMVDMATIRYQPIDSDKGVSIQTAWLTGFGRRIIQIIFNKGRYNWTLNLAKTWYKENFPYVYEFSKCLETDKTCPRCGFHDEKFKNCFKKCPRCGYCLTCE